MSGQLIFQHQDGQAPEGLLYHGRDQKVTMFARAGVASISVGSLVSVIPDGMGWTIAAQTLPADGSNLASGQLFRVGIVRGFRHQKSTVSGAEEPVIVGDLVEVQIGGYANVSLSASTLTPAVGSYLGVTTSSPYMEVLAPAAANQGNYGKASNFASIEAAAAESRGGIITAIHLFGVDVRI